MSDFVVEIIGNKTFSPKATSVPTFDKVIDDNADANDSGSGNTGDNTSGDEGDSTQGNSVTVSYVDEAGIELADAVVMNGETGSAYNTEEKSFDGYTLIRIKGGKTGVFSEKNQDVSYIYAENTTLSVAPYAEIEDWKYELDENEQTITLIQYIGSSENVTVYSAYQSGDKIYSTKIASYDSDEYQKNYMFYNNTSVKEIVFQKVDTSNTYDMSHMFHFCSALTNLDLSGLDTDNVANMSYMFCACQSLTSLDVSGFDTSKVTDMSYMFGCSILTSLDVSSFDTSKVTDMNHMFSCYTLTSLDLSGFNTSNVTDMNHMFYYCSALTSLDLNGLDTGNVANMNGMFYECRALTNLDVSSFDTSNVTDMGYMFSGCRSLTSLDVSGFDTSKVTDMKDMFKGCQSLTSLDVSGFDTSKVTNMDCTFASCSSLTSLDVSSFDTNKVTDMGCTFANCSSLTSLDVIGFDTSNVTYMADMFAGCSSLTSLDVSSFDTSKVTDMRDMFSSCSSLTSLDVSSFDTSKAGYMMEMFAYCGNLKKIYVSEEKWITSQANTTYMFNNCGTQNVTYKDSVSAKLNDFYNVLLPVSLAAENRESSADTVNTDTSVKYGVGDSVPFKLIATMPDSISAYETYKLVFHDSMTDGLTYDEGSLKVFVGDTEIDPSEYPSAYTVKFNGQQFTVEITDAKVAPFNAVAGTEISVKYTATVNDSAVFKNINNAWLEYSNNPNGEGTGTTVSDDVTAFTFTMNIDKVDKDGNELAGAGFTLYKKTEDGYVQFGDEITGGTNFSFSGLAVGDYKLVESTTPDGYNTMEDLEFSVVADSMEDADGNAYVTGLKIVAQGGTLDSDMIEGWTADTDTGILTADIANYKGSELPSTGGMGTVMFYVTGGVIVLAVCIVFVKKRREQAV